MYLKFTLPLQVFTKLVTKVVTKLKVLLLQVNLVIHHENQERTKKNCIKFSSKCLLFGNRNILKR